MQRNIVYPDLVLPDFSDFPNGSGSFHFLSGIRRHLHQHPELGFHEVQTAKFLKYVLEKSGLNPSRTIGKTGFFVDVEGQPEGRAVGFRADMDALPIQDLKNVSYASKTSGKAHLCGHDVHSTVALGVALSLYAKRQTFRGKVRVFFQPAEETSPSGAPLMIRDGVLDGLEAAFAIHVDPTLPTGMFGLKSGASTAAADTFEVRVSGEKTGHSARPHESGDPVWVLSQIMNALYQLVGRITDSRNPAILTICMLEAGKALNVIPQTASFGGTLRVADPQDRLKLRQQLIQTAEQIGALYSRFPEVTYQFGAPAVINDEKLHELMVETTRRLFGSQAIFLIPRPSMGAEDFSHYGAHVPIYLVRVGTQSNASTAYPLHDARFDADEHALQLAIQLMTESLIHFLDS